MPESTTIYQKCYNRVVLAQELIRRARKRAGLTQAELADRAGTTQSAVARWESGRVSPRMETFERLTRACGFVPHVVLSRETAEDRDQIRERLRWTPKQRLDYLLDMLAFEERGRRAERVRKAR
jgi:transcriptional regulator with XRE-family HTH domain